MKCVESGGDFIKILFITSDYSKPNKGENIYTDLAKALNNKHDIKVVATEEKKNTNKTYLNKENGIDVLRVKIGNLYEVGLIEKGFTILTIGYHLKKGIKKFFSKEKFDLILFQSPPLTMASAVKWAMKKYCAPSYLMMKDIFPQNGVDIGLYKKNSLIYKYFRLREKKLYKTASKIGCMSMGNIDYLLKHNDFLKKDKLELFPNTVNVNNIKKISKEEKEKIRKKYKIKKDDIVAIYGGNFGKPQGLDYLIDIIDYFKNNNKVKFLLVGKGTEKERIFNVLKDKKYKNVLLFNFLPREDYEKLSAACDIGLIFLDKRFTIPNFPSKTLSYFACSLPIMASTDCNTDYKDFIVNENVGFWAESKNIKEYTRLFNKLVEDKELREQMGKNGFKYLKENWNVKNSVKIIERFMGDKDEYI